MTSFAGTSTSFATRTCQHCYRAGTPRSRDPHRLALLLPIPKQDQRVANPQSAIPMFSALVAVTAFLALTGPDRPAGATTRSAVKAHALVAACEQIDVPARTAGELVVLEAREGLE